MRTLGIPVPGIGLRQRRIGRAGRASCSTLLILGCVALAVPASAGAWEEPKAPEYSLSATEGVTTLPEESILNTSGSVRPGVETALTIVHDNAVVAKDTDPHGNVWLSQVPQVGDVVNLEVPPGHPVGSVVYDGLPSIEPSVCAGSTNFSGQRTAGMEVSGSAFTLVSHPSYTARDGVEDAQVTTLSGQSFGGAFLMPLAIGQTVEAREQLQTPLAGGATFTYSSRNERPVGACPLPPPPPPPPPAAPALQGAIFKLPKITIAKLLKFGWVDEVTINQPGTVIQDLYLQGASVPATASVAKRGGHRRRKSAALLLARGTASAKAAGEVTVTIRPTAQGRRRLEHARDIDAVLLTTLDAAGKHVSLGRRSVSLNR